MSESKKWQFHDYDGEKNQKKLLKDLKVQMDVVSKNIEQLHKDVVARKMVVLKDVKPKDGPKKDVHVKKVLFL